LTKYRHLTLMKKRGSVGKGGKGESRCNENKKRLSTFRKGSGTCPSQRPIPKKNLGGGKGGGGGGIFLWAKKVVKKKEKKGGGRGWHRSLPRKGSKPRVQNTQRNGDRDSFWPRNERREEGTGSKHGKTPTNILASARGKG